MNPILVILILLCYVGLLMLISFLTSKKADTKTFFTANKQSPWFLVAFGMIGASLSGVTFISVPGDVGIEVKDEGVIKGFSYFQIVLGYLVGYFVIATILMPIYYRLNLISIYTYLEQRFGKFSYKTGAFYFLLSRTIGAAFRLFLVAGVLQLAIFDVWKIPFWVSIAVTIVLIWLYTFRGGIKTIVWTDTLQTLFMLLSVGISIYWIISELDLTLGDALNRIHDSKYSKIFFWDSNSNLNFIKQFVFGAFVAIAMTGLDQDMMQKNLTCRNLIEAQKNIFWFSIILVVVNLLFLSLGALLYIFAFEKGILLPEKPDNLFPALALDHFPIGLGIIFLLGITAAAYSSADSALTSLTTSFCIDFLGFNNKNFTKPHKSIRIKVHLGFSLVLFVVVLLFKYILQENVISDLFRAAGYTYGPLLGLFAFGIFTKLQVRDRWTPIVCIISPILSYIINVNSTEWFGGFKIGFMILLLNGALTFLGLLLISVSKKKTLMY